MSIQYCERWWFARKQPIKPLRVEEAKRRHDRRQPYVAVTGGFDAPACLVEVADGWVSTIFLDHEKRMYLRYDFKKQEDGRLFLKTAKHFEYGHDALTNKKVFNFNIDGTADIEEILVGADETTSFTIETDLTPNWDSYPRFGEYESLCREDREGRYDDLAE